MAQELWVSRITGYRRKGTRLAELRALFENGVSARAILEPLQSCPAAAGAIEMARLLHARDFDVAGVQEERGAPISMFVRTEWLQHGLVRDYAREIPVQQVISEGTSLAKLLSLLKDRTHVFVLVGPELRGIITRADLNKPPMRVYLFGLISLLEMHVSFWAKDAYPNGQWKSVLPAERITQAEALLNKRRAQNQHISLFDCLQFCDKEGLVIKSDQLREGLGLGSKANGRSYFAHAQTLRDHLAHSQHDLTEGSSWEKVIAVVEWIEAVLARSDEMVEKEAIKSTAADTDGLWASA